MIGEALNTLGVLKEYGLAGVLAWLFWWTLRRMTASHDATVRGLKEQLEAQMQAARAAAERFGEVVQNHLAHVAEALTRFDSTLNHSVEDQKRWQDRLLETLEKLADRLDGERRA
jgi:hypothetical protein